MKKLNQNSAVIFIDVINDFKFSSGEKLLKNTRTILPNLIKLKQQAKENNIPIIYVNDHYQTWNSDYKQICTYCINENNKDIIEPIMPTKQDYFFIKPKLSGFFHTPLASLLRELQVTNIVLAGIAAISACCLPQMMHTCENFLLLYQKIV